MNIIDNGLWSLLEALRHINKIKVDVRNTHSAILRLGHALELILKSALFNEHWAFIFEDFESANLEDLKTNSFK
ncbi:hypothetical protein, partial [Paenibacillus lautus]|uniref:hypothetical protein n=1 Tax=Paenibacillus lautus TaxID=1401 RepID=UPI001C7D97D0